MNDFESSFSQTRELALRSLTQSNGLIFPRYSGESILNILPTVARFFDMDGFQHTPIDKDLLSPIDKKPKNIILILMDALAYHRLEAWLARSEALGWHTLKENGLLLPLTSICPSTTSAAITSYWTDSEAAVHGIMGYEMWLKEYGITANMIEHKPIAYRSGSGGLSLAGFDPDTFLPVDSIAGKFMDQGVEIHAFQHFAIINSGLSQMFMGQAERHAIGTPADMWIAIRELLESNTSTRNYIWAYWGQLDGTSHLYGPDSERAEAEFFSFSKAFDDHFLGKLNPAVKEDTLVILTADHGQIATDPGDNRYDLNNHPRFTEMLHMKPTGENRLAYLHVKPGMIKSVKEYIQNAWPGGFAVFDTGTALEEGLFGTGSPHPDIHNRLGDLVAAAKRDHYWWWGAKPNPLIGRHGGLSSQEMLVPFLAGYL